jgi:hypothetical protein
MFSLPMSERTPATRQDLFRELLVGTLIYSVVFGFFDDYTDLLVTSSYSMTFLAALVMQSMVYPTFRLKGWIARWFRGKEGPWNKVGLVLGVWSVMFFSKFVFLAVIDRVFGRSVEISGFIGLAAMILCATALSGLSNLVHHKLGAA